MVAFLFQQQKALCHFSLLVTPISLRIFSILLQKRRQYCLLRIQCKKGLLINSATKITSQTLRIGQTGWTSNGYREQTKDFDIPASQKDWTKYPDSSWAGVLVDATNCVGCYYVVNIAAKTGKTWYVEISNNIR